MDVDGSEVDSDLEDDLSDEEVSQEKAGGGKRKRAGKV